MVSTGRRMARAILAELGCLAWRSGRRWSAERSRSHPHLAKEPRSAFACPSMPVAKPASETPASTTRGGPQRGAFGLSCYPRGDAFNIIAVRSAGVTLAPCEADAEWPLRRLVRCFWTRLPATATPPRRLDLAQRGVGVRARREVGISGSGRRAMDRPDHGSVCARGAGQRRGRYRILQGVLVSPAPGPPGASPAPSPAASLRGGRAGRYRSSAPSIGSGSTRSTGPSRSTYAVRSCFFGWRSRPSEPAAGA